MTLPKSIRENLHFLLAETDAHLGLLKEYLTLPTAGIPTRLIDRQGYVENLRLSIHNHCLRALASSKDEEADPQRFRAVEAIATQLERIAELCRDAVLQGSHLQDKGQLKVKDYLEMLDRVSNGVEWIEPALEEKDTRRALKIGKVEQHLDQAYQKQLSQSIRSLKKEKRPADRISLILLAHRIEQMGGALLRISEAIISDAMGQHFNTERYHALNASIDQLSSVDDIDQVSVEKIAETRSGSAISGVSAGGDGYDAIFKDGQKRKLKEERARVKDWHEIIPGLAPKILSYHKQGESAALLVEHLAGETFEQILLHGSDKLLQEAFDHLTRTLKRIWIETRSKKPVAAGYMKQLAKRMETVYTVHPEFNQSASRIGAAKLASFDQLLEKTERLEASVKTPFSVYIHGDFNVDNIIYDPGEGRINFIDLHRSRYMDYLQDVTVFMVSNYRLQVFEPRVRRRIVELCHAFYRFTRDFARKQDDEDFEVRLALGLIRSFTTSTRFILDKSLSRAMFLRAIYLMERLLAAEAERKTFKTPIQEIFVG
ncbi:MAG: phosphotransferase [Candidatus Thiodiazotropha sp. (ex Monitilora ramsayi)]|nr:phosphotransferase [Candidatus Thiodiazotropha sp. (ex Monitilora ramsayi)]